MLKRVYPAADVLMIEAQERMLPELSAVIRDLPGRITVETALLGAQDGVLVDFVEMGTGSSIFEEQSPFPRTRLKKSTISLDTLLENMGERRSADLIKLDVQGGELEVLKGGARTLAATSFVLLEASLIPTNQQAPLIAEVFAFMDAAGFRLLDFFSQTRRRDMALWQTDLLFVRSDSEWVPDPSLAKANW